MAGLIQRILLLSDEDGQDAWLRGVLSRHITESWDVAQLPMQNIKLESFARQGYALIVVDMPPEGDCEAVRQFCDANSGVPIILLSSHGFNFEARVIQKDDQLVARTIQASLYRSSMEEEVGKRDAILQAVNEAAARFLAEPDWETCLKDVLEGLGEATCSERVYVFRNEKTKDENPLACTQAVWQEPGLQVHQTGSLPEGMDYYRIGFQRWVERMRAGRVIQGHVEDQPAKEQPLLKMLAIQSFACVPVFAGGEWWGFIGFYQCTQHKTWSQIEMDTLRAAANIFGAAIGRKANEEQLTYLATHDYLTGLPNRLLFSDRFEQAIARAGRAGEFFALISVDMDKFKQVNDSHGHPTGDLVLIEVGKRLLSTLRSSDTCARIGGDEFVVLADRMREHVDVVQVLEKIQSVFGEPMQVDGKSIQVSASMGAAIFPTHGNETEMLLKAADSALYLAKNSSTSYKIYSDEQISWLKD